MVLAIDYQLEPVQDFRLNKAQSLQLHLRVPNKAKYKFLLVKMKKKNRFHINSLALILA